VKAGQEVDIVDRVANNKNIADNTAVVAVGVVGSAVAGNTAENREAVVVVVVGLTVVVELWTVHTARAVRMMNMSMKMM